MGLTETICSRAGVLLQPGQSRLKVSPGFLTESAQCWKQKVNYMRVSDLSRS